MYTKIITTLYKVFFVGLLLQFFLQTFVTHQLGLDAEWMKYVWLRKEWVIAILWILALGHIIRNRTWKQIIASPTLGRRTLWLLATVALTAAIHIVLLWEPINTYVLAFKYDFVWFFILLVWLHSSAWLTKEIREEILLRYGKIIKRSLVAAIIWYLIIFIKPWTLKLFWYDNFMYEWSVWVQPPAAYYTLINHGLTRNQFLFERPISRWFFLTAFFPLFFMLFLYKKPLKHTWSRWILYGLNILFTFSRAAWWSWIIELVCIWLILYWKNLKKFMLYILLPIFVIIIGIWSVAYKSVFQRSYSTNGHIEMLVNGTNLYMKSPLLWHGWWRAGPASHREWWPKFNPENQFLQILIEFGALWFLPWFMLYLTLNLRGVQLVREMHKNALHAQSRSYAILLFASVSIWMIWLSASWMVLHSFSDRMIVYPFMLVFWIVWMQWLDYTKE